MNWAALSVEEAVEPVEFVVIHLDDQFVSTQCSHEGQGPGFGGDIWYVSPVVHKRFSLTNVPHDQCSTNVVNIYMNY